MLLFCNKKHNIQFDYYHLLNLQANEYPRYLAELFYIKTGEKLPLSRKLKLESGKLKDFRVDFSLPNILNIFDGDFIIDKNKCKTFNQKIQWIKLYGVTDLMRKCTDKVLVRDYVAEKISSEYLKPVLQIIPSNSYIDKALSHCEQISVNSGFAWQSTDKKQTAMDCHEDTKISLSSRNDRQLDDLQTGFNDISTYFDQIDFNKLPNSFVIKCNHGCKWQYIIKNKEKFLKNLQLYEYVKRQMAGWLEQEWFVWGGFELNYKGIKPKILIEKLLREEINTQSKTVQFYCFNGNIKLVIELFGNNQSCLYDEKLNIIDDVLSKDDIKKNQQAKSYVKLALVLSKKLAKDFNFVRVDWMIYQGIPYFEELTFTPNSGFHNFGNTDIYKKMGDWLNI